jgi:EpsI family protein
MALGSWQGRNVELKRAERVYAVLETTSVLSRVYEKSSAKGEVVDLLVTYFERGHRGFHPPEVSFVASGNTIIKSGIVRIPLADGENAPRLEANMFLGNTPTGEVLFLYWFGIGERLMASYSKGSAYLLWNTVLQRPSPASMVRLALPVVNGDLEKTMATAREFIWQIAPILPEYLTEHPRLGSPTR